MIVSRSGTEYPRAPPLCEEALQERELVWARLPKTIYQGTLSCLSVRDCLNLDSAMTNTESRPHLVKAFKDMVSPAFNRHVYTDEKYKFRALRWVMKREINLRGFSMEVKTSSGLNRKSGPVLTELMLRMENNDVDIARYYLARAKLESLDEQHGGLTALTYASFRGYLDIVEGLLTAGADKDGVTWHGTPCIMAAKMGHVKIVRVLLAAGVDKEKSDDDGNTALIWATIKGHIEVARALLEAGADKDKANKEGDTAASTARQMATLRSKPCS